METIEFGKTIKTLTVDAGKTLYNTVKTTFGSTDAGLLNKLKSSNNNMKNLVETTKEIKIDV